MSNNNKISILSDTAFKHIFGEEGNKEITIAFLNAYLRGERHVTHIDFQNTEIQPDYVKGKRIVLDILCKDETGATFNIEMQVARHAQFKDRVLFYHCRRISNQKIQGDNYKLQPTYTVALLNFNLRSNKVFNDYVIADKETGKQFYDNFKITLVQLPRLKDSIEKEKITDNILKKWYEWITLLANLQTMETMPEFMKNDPAMVKLWNQAQIDSLSKEQRERYEEEMKLINDLIYSETMNEANIEAAREEGREEGLEAGRKEGREEGRKEGWDEGKKESQTAIAKAMKAKKYSLQDIADLTGLSIKEIKSL